MKNEVFSEQDEYGYYYFMFRVGVRAHHRVLGPAGNNMVENVWMVNNIRIFKEQTPS